jgi:predicted GNAT family acetyltransferase
VAADSPTLPVQHDQHPGRSGFFIDKDGARVALMAYHREGEIVTITHTEVSDVLRGQGAGRRLLDELVRWARQDHLQVVPRCPYARATFAKHPELRDVLAPDVAL